MLQPVVTTDTSEKRWAMDEKQKAARWPIGRIAAQTRVNIETIRYYERIGIVTEPPRTSGRHRAYDDQHVQRLIFIRRSRELGFSLDNIRELLELADRSNKACSKTKDLTLRQLADVRGKITSLRKLEHALRVMTEACEPGSDKPCPILDALSLRN